MFAEKLLHMLYGCKKNLWSFFRNLYNFALIVYSISSEKDLRSKKKFDQFGGKFSSHTAGIQTGEY